MMKDHLFHKTNKQTNKQKSKQTKINEGTKVKQTNKKDRQNKN